MSDDLRFAQYQRLEPRVRPDGHSGFLDIALEGRVADPLFLLARQWQLAEFQGEDGGSPIQSHIEAQGAAITRFRPGDEGEPADLPADRPLEHVVEHGADTDVSMRDRARAGLHLLTLLGALADQVVAALVERCPLPAVPAIEGVPDPDPAGRALRGVLAARAPDGVDLARELAGGFRPPGLSAAQRDDFDAAVATWQAWFAAAHPAVGASCWVRERLEHRFSVGAAFGDEQVVLRAPEHGGGRLDAYHLELDTAGLALGADGAAVTAVQRTVLPTRATYPGMPAERWWEFEDATVNLPAISAGPADLARLLLLEFANIYGNDWWVIPVDLAVASVHRITTLTVTDTFGDTVEINPTDMVHADGWSMFRLTDSVSGGPADALLPLLPTATTLAEGEPVEEVLFVRDEMANLAWAVERVVQSATGRGRRRADEIAERDPSEVPADPIEGALVYRLMTPVPAHWIPLVPVPLREGSEAIQFRRGQIPRFDADGRRRPQVRAAGRVLEPDAKRVTFRDEEIPRAGVRVDRVPVLTRWLGGATAAWTSRRARTGRGEGSSGLAFDEARRPAR